MERIKAPVKVSDPYGEYATLFDADSEAILIGVPLVWCNQIALAVNLYDGLVDACESLLDLAIFMSGSTDFSPDGQGREGWLKLKPAIDQVRAILAKVEKEE